MYELGDIVEYWSLHWNSDFMFSEMMGIDDMPAEQDFVIGVYGDGDFLYYINIDTCEVLEVHKIDE